jgi:hypothetical protein
MEKEGMYVYRYRDIFLIIKMTIKVLIGLLVLSPILFLWFGRRQYIEFLLDYFLEAIFLLPLLLVIPVFILLFLMFYIRDKPLIFPQGHPQEKSRIIRRLLVEADYSPQLPINGPIPNPALQLRFVTPRGELGKNQFFFFPCPIFFPRNTRFYHKLLNGFWFSLPVDAQNGELFRCRGLFKTRNSLHQEVRGDLYIEVKIVRSRYYYLTALLAIGLFFLISIIEASLWAILRENFQIILFSPQ